MQNDSAGGWIKIHRKMLDWEWYSDTNVTRLFLHCLLKANFEDKRWRGMLIKRGSFVASMKTISDEIHLSPQEISTAFKKLETTGEVTRQATNQFTYVIINNYDSYQCFAETEQQTEQQTSNKRATNEQQQHKNDKNNKEIKNIYIYAIHDDMSEDERRFCENMPVSFPRICKMTEPLTWEQIQRLNKKYDRDAVYKVMLAMENRANLLKKYVSAYRTAINWLEVERKPKKSQLFGERFPDREVPKNPNYEQGFE